MKFKQLNFLTFDIMLNFVLMGGIGVFVLVAQPGNNPGQTMIFASICTLAPFVIHGPGLASTITINEEGVSVKGIFKKQHFNWQQVKSARVYRMKNFTWTQVDPPDYDNLGFFRRGFVFVSSERNFWPQKGANPGAIRFHCRPEAVELISRYMDQYQTQSVAAD